MIRPDNAEEMKTGNSFANPTNANFAMQLVVQLYRDAARVDAQQKHLYDLLLRQLTKAEVPQDLVEVRTKGFINEAPRMNVATTHARLGQFIIGPGKKTPLEWPLNHIVAFLEERSAVINLRGRCHWDLMCQNCCQPGHFATNCKFKPKCVRCDGAPHATRNCPRAEEDAISTSTSEPITAGDGIQRNVLNPPRVNFSDPKRSKKNSTTREEAFAKPNKQQDAMRKAYRDALYALRKARKDQDVEDLGTDEQGDDVSDDGEAGNEEAGGEGADDGISW
ncbi:hypothetical protein FPANT_8971 [Fusarium pseudoanthophilum]|uniref:CCHC-type domain-containing protein n=1 Tax=Fusarium pseudoanthophilum TaxID=48495 RepID=A0A8H5KYZ4_9HYPO|nr:hypothetical protein FPANT_8971 [Fusarium pseudoanthophilum]